jgi:hypothetical protein
MIIFGWTTRIKPTAHHGQFYCPHCRVSSTYAECRRKSYFHLFFIPVLPLSDDPHGVQCCNCKSTFDDEVLTYQPQQEMASWRCPQCNRNWPENNIRCPICKVRPDGTPR